MEQSLEDSYARFGPFVLRRCRALLRTDDAAQDAMHDVFVQLLSHRVPAAAHELAPWLNRVATNVCLNRLRSQRRSPLDQSDALALQIASTEEPGGQVLAGRMLEVLFGRFPVSSRDIAVLHLLDGLTLGEIAAEVGLSVSGVRKRLRALAAHGLSLEVPP
ncbi:MAG: sigma-70 family RNA polymerase sigma factor [Myxococcaceae bacterium]|nr:sigma-70 family RNA polymerase sigma factor [Myxococcaceae bacterium]